MEELIRLEKFQSVVAAATSHGLLSSSTSDSASSRFLSNLVLFLVNTKFSLFEYLHSPGNKFHSSFKVQPCDELDTDSRLALVSEFLPKVSKARIFLTILHEP